MNASDAIIWVSQPNWGGYERRVKFNGTIMAEADNHLLYKAVLPAAHIGGIRHPAVRVSALTFKINGATIDAFVAEMPFVPAYKRSVCMSTCKPNLDAIKEYPQLAQPVIHVPVHPEQGLDRFVAAAYQNWPFMMLIEGKEPIFYATAKSLNPAGQKYGKP